LTILNVLVSLSPGALAIAAHPKDPAPFLEKWLIRRGRWDESDCAHEVGLQILNGLDNDAFRQGLREWVRQLLKGQRVVLAAGNDAHGNFNRFRQVRTPMMALHEKENYQRMGWARTCVQIPALSVGTVLEAIRSGRSVITTGPVLRLGVQDELGKTGGVGDTLSAGRLKIRCEARSSGEFGRIGHLKILVGTVGGSEEILNEWNYSDQQHEVIVQSSHAAAAGSYIRAETRTVSGACCYTNPVWVTGGKT
jgi:hypothetical protein